MLILVALISLFVLRSRIAQKWRISGSLFVILVVFLITAVLVKVDMAPLTFFTVTMIKIICINCEWLCWSERSEKSSMHWLIFSLL